MANYKLTLLDEGIYFFAKEDVKLLGTELINDSFAAVLAYANQLKNDTPFVGEGELTIVESESLIDINHIDWYLLIDKETPSKYQIVRTSNDIPYTLPTNCESLKGSLDHIFEKIIELENT